MKFKRGVSVEVKEIYPEEELRGKKGIIRTSLPGPKISSVLFEDGTTENIDMRFLKILHDPVETPSAPLREAADDEEELLEDKEEVPNYP